MQERSIFSIDILIFVSTITLMVIGILFIYSSGVTVDGVSFSDEWIRQIVWAGLGLIILVSVSVLDYSRLRDPSVYIYVAILLVLVGTLLFGRVVNGARRWLGIAGFGVQPSEFAKIALILVLANFFDRRIRSASSPATFGMALLITLAPMGLILLQPDLGTALVFLPVCLAMAFVAGVRPSYILFIIASGLVMVVLIVLPAWQQEIHEGEVLLVTVLTDQRLFLTVAGGLGLVGLLGMVGLLIMKRGYFGWVIYGVGILLSGLVGSVVGRRVLKDYQLMRLIVFLEPNVDPRGAGWHIIQSVTAVGSGGITGKGWLEGTQSHLQYLPQQSTDFIFSILAEEWGFVGALIVFACFTIIILRGLMISAKARDTFAALLAAGVVTLTFFHVAINIGMAIGVMPITGIPLPFLSYGASSLWTQLTGMGLLMSIYHHRYR